ncbi:MAG: hypothetical protein ACE1YX_02760, partial [Nitrosopumilaceae archaeon]
MIDEFREKLHERFCVYDPLTIDDRVTQMKFQEWKSTGGVNPDDEIEITESDRWALGKDFSLVRETLKVDSDKSVYPIKLSVAEVKEVAEEKQAGSSTNASVIDNNIRTRDFRLIDQSDTMVQYRPNISGTISQGMLHEANYASNVSPRDWYFYWPDEDSELSSTPFSAYMGKGIQIKDKNKIIETLENKEGAIKNN